MSLSKKDCTYKKIFLFLFSSVRSSVELSPAQDQRSALSIVFCLFKFKYSKLSSTTLSCHGNKCFIPLQLLPLFANDFVKLHGFTTNS